MTFYVLWCNSGIITCIWLESRCSSNICGSIGRGFRTRSPLFKSARTIYRYRYIDGCIELLYATGFLASGNAKESMCRRPSHAGRFLRCTRKASRRRIRFEQSFPENACMHTPCSHNHRDTNVAIIPHLGGKLLCCRTLQPE